MFMSIFKTWLNLNKTNTLPMNTINTQNPLSQPLLAKLLHYNKQPTFLKPSQQLNTFTK